jgi:hypothetical protein
VARSSVCTGGVAALLKQAAHAPDALRAALRAAGLSLGQVLSLEELLKDTHAAKEKRKAEKARRARARGAARRAPARRRDRKVPHAAGAVGRVPRGPPGGHLCEALTRCSAPASQATRAAQRALDRTAEEAAGGSAATEDWLPPLLGVQAAATLAPPLSPCGELLLADAGVVRAPRAAWLGRRSARGAAQHGARAAQRGARPRLTPPGRLGGRLVMPQRADAYAHARRASRQAPPPLPPPAAPPPAPAAASPSSSSLYVWPPSPPHHGSGAAAAPPLPLREPSPHDHGHGHALLPPHHHPLPPLSPCFTLALPPLYEDAPLPPPPPQAQAQPPPLSGAAPPSLADTLRFPADDPLAAPSAWPSYVPSPECAAALAYFATFRGVLARSAPGWSDATATRVLESRWRLLSGREKAHYARVAHEATVRGGERARGAPGRAGVGRSHTHHAR